MGEPDLFLQKIPSRLQDILLPFQKEGVKYAISKNGRCLIADEMGLGKTLQAISVACCYRDEWPLLIIVPSSLKFCWIEELEKWLPDLLPQQINLVQCGADVSGIADSLITIISYGLLRLPSNKVVREAIQAQKFKVIICDESHYLKNSKTVQCKTVVPFIKTAQRRILLSGTPALAKPVELYSQIDAICPGTFGSFWQFTDRYCDAHTKFYGTFRKREVSGASNLEELQKRLTSALMIRREKSEVLTELPPKQRQKVLFELKQSTLKTEILDKFAKLRGKIFQGDKSIQEVLQSRERNVEQHGPESESREAVENDEGDSDRSVNMEVSHLYRLSGEAKIGPVQDYLEMLCENEKLKFLVFAYHHNMMDGIQQTLWNKKVKFVRIDGNTKGLDRQACVTQFQSDPNTRVAILSILAAGVGLTFTAAKLVVFAELYWTPGVMFQCEDRAHRIGQTSSLPVHYLVARGTMDEWVWSAVCKKTVVTSTALMGRSKQLDHHEGDSYQVDILSKADVRKAKRAEVNTNVNVEELINSQRPADQPSIEELFSSQVERQSAKSKSRKRKFASSSGIFGQLENSFTEFKHASSKNDEITVKSKSKSDPVTEVKHSEIGDALKSSQVICVSDEEDPFKTTVRQKLVIKKSSKKRKKKHAPKKEEDSDILSQFLPHPSDELLSIYCQSTQEQKKDTTSEPHIEHATTLDPKVEPTLDPEIETILDSEIEPVSDKEVEPTLDKKAEANLDKKIETALDSEVESASDKEIERVKPSTSDTCNRLSSAVNDTSELIKTDTAEKRNSTEWVCGLCTFLNHPELPNCEMCDTPKRKKSARIQKNSNVKSSRCSCCELNKMSERTWTSDKGTPSKRKCISRDLFKDEKENLSSGDQIEECKNVDTDFTVLMNSRDSSRKLEPCDYSKHSKANPDLENKDIIPIHSNSICDIMDEDNLPLTEDNDEIHNTSVVDSSMDLNDLSHPPLFSSSATLQNLTTTEGRCDSPDLFDEGVGDKENLENCQDIKDVDSNEESNLSQDSYDIHNISSNESDLEDLSKFSSNTDFSASKVAISRPSLPEQIEKYPVPSSSTLSSPARSSLGTPKGQRKSSVLRLQDPPASSNESPATMESRNCVVTSTSMPSSVTGTEVSAVAHTSSELASESIAMSLPVQFEKAAVTVVSNDTICAGKQPDPKQVSNQSATSCVHNDSSTRAITEPFHKILQFSCSVYTGRIFVYDEKGHFLEASFQPLDVEMGNTGDMSQILQKPEHLKILKKFVREWSSLTDTKKRLIAKRGLVFTSPQAAYYEVRSAQGNKQRHLTKKDQMVSAVDSAKDVQGSVRMITKHSIKPVNVSTDFLQNGEPSVPGIAQTVTKEGVPLCIQCHKPYTNSLLSAKTVSNPENAWQLRFCSYPCMDKYWTLTKAGYLRDRIYEVERGVCSLCHYDAHSLYTQIKITKDLTVKAELINSSHYSSLRSKQKQKMVTQPHAGQFWHVDHITPVWQGGGMCDLDNLRTLCTPCHLKVTSKQASQRAAARKLGGAASKGDITAFFQKS